MKTESLHVGMKIRHPQHGIGTVKSISEHTADVRFDDELRTISPEQSDIQPGEALAEISGLSMPLTTFIAEAVHRMVKELNLEQDDSIVEELGLRWRNGTMLLRPSEAALQPKEVPLETFFHKIVMMRNNFRVLEQKINAHPQLSDAEKVEMQQYISKCYGTMTTFNILFKNEDGHFKSGL